MRLSHFPLTRVKINPKNHAKRQKAISFLAEVSTIFSPLFVPTQVHGSQFKVNPFAVFFMSPLQQRIRSGFVCKSTWCSVRTGGTMHLV